MSNELWGLFPFPTIDALGTTDGSLHAAHSDCVSCPTRACLDDASCPPAVLKECRFGITYSRIDDVRLVAGVLASDAANPTKRARRRLRLEPERRVRTNAVESAIARARSLGSGVVADYQLAKAEVMHELQRNPELHAALADQLRRDFEDNLNQSHDFLQLVKLVRGHAEALLHEKLANLPPEEAAEQLQTEGAIYFSTELMLVKMDSMLFLNEINRVHGGQSRFQIHPFLIKYLRIYRWQADQKDLKIHVEGNCYGRTFYNSQAIGAVLQGLLDNLVKYAPAGSDAYVSFEEDDDSVRLTFTSLGPRIEPDELARIFLPKYRARAARRAESSGLGVGLATAKQISDALDLNLSVEQDSAEHRIYKERFKTTFSFRLERVS